MSSQIDVDESKCIGCGECVRVCPNNVYEIVRGKSRPIRPESCVYCRSCIVHCPVSAIRISPRDVRAYYARFYKK